jgi:hypothetical protein
VAMEMSAQSVGLGTAGPVHQHRHRVLVVAGGGAPGSQGRAGRRDSGRLVGWQQHHAAAADDLRDLRTERAVPRGALQDIRGVCGWVLKPPVCLLVIELFVCLSIIEPFVCLSKLFVSLAGSHRGTAARIPCDSHGHLGRCGRCE